MIVCLRKWKLNNSFPLIMACRWRLEVLVKLARFFLFYSERCKFLKFNR